MLKRPQILVLALVSMVFATLLLAPAQASAATLSEDAEKFLRYRAIRGCLAHKDMEGTDPTRIMKGDWWKTQAETLHRDLGGALITGKNPAISCEDGDGDNFIEDSAGVLGFSNPGSMWCSVQPIANRDNEGSGNDFEKCVSGSGDYDASGSKSDQAAQFTEGIKNYSSIGSTFPFDATGAVKYYIYFETFKKFCDVEREKNYIERTDKALADSKEYVVVNEVVLDNGEPKIVPALYKVNKDNGQDHKVEGVWSLPDGDMYNLDCGELAGKTWDFDEDYGRYIAANPDEAVETGGGTGGAVGANTPVCTAGALGWVICPAINFIATMTDGIYSIVENMLVIDPMTVENGGSLYQTWTRFRDIANVLFVIAFFFVIFSQATSVGLSSYGVKKLLPRVIASAILVNISFFLCQIALDLSNIVGVTIDDMFASLHSGDNVDINVISWETLIAGIIGGGAIWGGAAVVLGAGGITAAMAMILPFLVTALFAIVTAIAVLIARQVIIVLLIALAPLAFVAFILPNTQKYFQLWQNTFITMMVMFPLIAALFAGSQLAANIILTSPTSADGIGLFTYIAAICMLFIPLFGIPYIVKFSGGLLGRVAGVVNNPNKGPFDSLRKKAEGYRDYKQDQARGRNSLGKGNALTKSTFGKYSRMQRRKESLRNSVKREADRADTEYIANELDNNEKFRAKSAGGRALQGPAGTPQYEAAVARARAQGVSALDKLQGEELSAAKTVIDNMQFTNKQLKSLAVSGATANDAGVNLSGDFYQKAAQQQLISTGQAGHIYSMLDNASGMSEDVRGSMAYHLAQNYSTLKAKDHSLNNDAFKTALTTGASITPEMKQNASLAQLSGLTKEVFSGTDQQGIVNLKAAIDTARANGTANNPEVRAQIDKALGVAAEAWNDNNLKKNWTAESEVAVKNLLGIQGNQPPSGGPTPSTPGGGPAPWSGSGGPTPPPAPSGGGPTPRPPAGVPAPSSGSTGAPLPTPSGGGGNPSTTTPRLVDNRTRAEIENDQALDQAEREFRERVRRDRERNG